MTKATPAKRQTTDPAQASGEVAPALAIASFSAAEVEANHGRLETRNATHRHFGYDAEAAVQFALADALPISP